MANRIAQAAAWATELHDGQFRTGTPLPYIVHPAAVAALVAADGGSEDEIIAAWLHDVVEDTDATIEQVRERFGNDVAAIVATCTDTTQRPKPKWKPRKEAWLATLGSATPVGAWRVIAADKLHNINSTLHDLDAIGDAVWAKFAAKPVEQRWYFTRIADVVGSSLSTDLATQLGRAVKQLNARISA